MTTKSPEGRQGFIFTFGVKDQPPEQITIVAATEEEAKKAAEAHRAANNYLSAMLWDTVPAPKVLVVSGDMYLPIVAAENAKGLEQTA